MVVDCIKRKSDNNIRCYLYLMLFVFTIRNMMEAVGLNFIFFVLSSIYFMAETTEDDYFKFSIRKNV